MRSIKDAINFQKYGKVCLLFVRKQNKTQLKNLILKNNEKDFGFHQERLGVDSH